MMYLHVHHQFVYKIVHLITCLQLFSGKGGRKMAAGGLRPLAQQGEGLLLHLLCNGQVGVDKAGDGVGG